MARRIRGIGAVAGVAVVVVGFSAAATVLLVRQGPFEDIAAEVMFLGFLLAARLPRLLFGDRRGAAPVAEVVPMPRGSAQDAGSGDLEAA